MCLRCLTMTMTKVHAGEQLVREFFYLLCGWSLVQQVAVERPVATAAANSNAARIFASVRRYRQWRWLILMITTEILVRRRLVLEDSLINPRKIRKRVIFPVTIQMKSLILSCRGWPLREMMTKMTCQNELRTR